MNSGFTESELMAELPKLHRFACSVMSNASEEDREDTVATVLSRAWRYRHTFKQDSQLLSWLCRILLRTAHTEGRKISLRRESELSPIFGDDRMEWASHDFQTDLIVMLDVERALAEIPDEEREAILAKARGETLAAHARSIQRSAYSLRERVGRARSQLEELCQAS